MDQPTGDSRFPEPDTISAESGFNDGLALPIVFLPILLLARPAGEALAHWLTQTILWEVGAGATLGALVGYAAARALGS